MSDPPFSIRVSWTVDPAGGLLSPQQTAKRESSGTRGEATGAITAGGTRLAAQAKANEAIRATGQAVEDSGEGETEGGRREFTP